MGECAVFYLQFPLLKTRCQSWCFQTSWRAACGRKRTSSAMHCSGVAGVFRPPSAEWVWLCSAH